MIVGGVLGGLANALYSGSFEALVYETCDQANRRNDFASVIASAGACRHIALALGTVVALIVSIFWGLTILAWVAVLANLGEVVTSLFFKEPMVQRQEKLHPWKMLKNSLYDFRQSAKLRQISYLEIFDYSLHWTNLSVNGLYFQTIVPLWVINVATFAKHIFATVGFSMFKKFKNANMFKILTYASGAEAIAGMATILINNICSPFIWAAADFFAYLGAGGNGGDPK